MVRLRRRPRAERVKAMARDFQADEGVEEGWKGERGWKVGGREK